MKLYVIFGQRRERFANEQLAPEALAVITEYDHDENPDYLKGEYTKYKENTEFDSVRTVCIDLGREGGAEIRRLLSGVPEIPGMVKAV